MPKTQLCIHCACPSLKGMKKGKGLCAYHWCLLMWGKAYADKCHPEHATAHKEEPTQK